MIRNVTALVIAYSLVLIYFYKQLISECNFVNDSHVVKIFIINKEM